MRNNLGNNKLGNLNSNNLTTIKSRLMADNWVIKPKAPESLFQEFSQLNPTLVQLLYNRGLTEEKQVGIFLRAEYSELLSPFLFKDMQKAVDRLFLAIENKEKIFIYGDYDADAITANALLKQAFNFFGISVESYIPDRFSEGYGVNMEAMALIKSKGAKIIITVDCGTNSTEAAKWCGENGIDFIITDHHEIIGDSPKAFCLINPKNPEDAYPDKNITGVGVAFKLAAALLSDKRAEKFIENYKPGLEKWLLDLVAIGTVADCHSLVGENRIFVKYGLRVLQKTKWTGLRALMYLAGLLKPDADSISLESVMDFKNTPDTYALGFVIAPRINAAGRLEHADVALNLLMEKNLEEALLKADSLENVNKRRQDLTARVLSEARAQAEIIRHRKVLVLSGSDWPKGVVGLVAGRLAEEFYRPTIVLSKETETATGSARTVGGFSIIEALKHASLHIERFGGHQQAAGLTILNSKFEVFYQSVLLYAEANLETNSKILDLDMELLPEDLNLQVYNTITVLQPFGVGNLKPKFFVRNAVLQSLKLVGNEGKHAQAVFKFGEKLVSAIGFNMAGLFQNFLANEKLDIACELLADSWNNNIKLKLRILDIKKSV